MLLRIRYGASANPREQSGDSPGRRSGFVATLLRSGRSFAPNLGTSRGQHALLEERDCELGEGVLGGVSLASQP
jgi:hypothetical protein